jgi:plasmid replication initiation protein
MQTTANAADRIDQQLDLVLDTLVSVPLKDDRALMEFPFFSIEKTPRMDPLTFDDGKVKVVVTPGAKGLATMWDKDVLIYAATLINDRLERGLPVERTIRFAAHDLLKITGRGTGKRSYDLLLDALFRLRSTTIETSIEAADQRERRGFGWIEGWRIVERKTAAGKKGF